MRKLLGFLAFVAIAFPAPAAAQQCFQNGVVCVGGPSIADILQFAQPTSGQTVQITPTFSAIILNPAGLLASLTVMLPPNPVDGQRAIIASTAVITLLTVSATGASVQGGLGSLSLNGYERFIYSAQLNTWVRTG